MSNSAQSASEYSINV